MRNAGNTDKKFPSGNPFTLPAETMEDKEMQEADSALSMPVECGSEDVVEEASDEGADDEAQLTDADQEDGPNADDQSQTGDADHVHPGGRIPIEEVIVGYGSQFDLDEEAAD
jgi:hypothetical protein